MTSGMTMTIECPRCNGEGDRPDGTCWLCEPVITTRKQRARWRLAIAAVSVHKRNESPR